MRKVALLACLALVMMASLAFGAVAYGDDDDDHHRSHDCEYEHGHWECDDD